VICCFTMSLWVQAVHFKATRLYVIKDHSVLLIALIVRVVLPWLEATEREENQNGRIKEFLFLY
jgi:hypothetical protein